MPPAPPSFFPPRGELYAPASPEHVVGTSPTRHLRVFMLNVGTYPMPEG